MCCEYNDSTLEARAALTQINPVQDLDINDLFFNLIITYLENGQSILDIGTGNGFVLREICDRSPYQDIDLYGIDGADKMVQLAKNNLGDEAKIVKASADELPFKNNSFDLVVAKNVTRINPVEIYRILKHGGTFVFREYGQGKGLCEIATLFPGRIIRQRNPFFYIDGLYKAGLSIISFNLYTITRKYGSIEDIITIVKSFPFIENFSPEDERKIINLYHDTKVTSDPFILVCRKE